MAKLCARIRGGVCVCACLLGHSAAIQLSKSFLYNTAQRASEVAADFSYLLRFCTLNAMHSHARAHNTHTDVYVVRSRAIYPQLINIVIPEIGVWYVHSAHAQHDDETRRVATMKREMSSG